MIEIGALTTHSTMEKSPLLLRHAPSLAKACAEIGSPQTRSRGTLGGNLANASPAADTAPPLLCLDAEAQLTCSDGQRNVKLLDFFRTPGKTCLQKGEFLRGVRFAIPSGKWGSSSMRLGCRKGMSIAVVGVSVYLVLDDAGNICFIRVALGSVAPTPVRALSAEAELLGQKPGTDLFSLAARALDADINPITDVRASADYRRHSARILLGRSLEEAWRQAEGRNA
jgi:carbon-monoxide dehydrogenase medium subunit